MREKFVTKCVRLFITKCKSFITKCVDFFTKYDVYYKMRRYNVVDNGIKE